MGLTSEHFGDRRGRALLLFALALVIVCGGSAVVPVSAPAAVNHPRSHARAVLPFAGLSGTDEYLGDGLAEEVMHALGAIADIRVVAKPPASAFEMTATFVRSGASCAQGRCWKAACNATGDRLRVDCAASDATPDCRNGRNVTTGACPTSSSVENQIATGIVGRLVGTLAPGARTSTAPTADIEAYMLFLRANHRMRQRGAENLTHAIDLYQQAIGRDGNFGRAYAGLAEAFMLQPGYAGGSEKAAHARALAAAGRAESLGEGTGLRSGCALSCTFVRASGRQPTTTSSGRSPRAPTIPICCSGTRSTSPASVGSSGPTRSPDGVAADPLSPVANQRAGV
jgi:hypothetical protein